jgi:hypothetical protein
MLVFVFDRTGAVLQSVTTKFPKNREDLRCVYRGDLESYADALALAGKANALQNGYSYLATDAGPHCYPRFDVVKAPEVGAAVSYGFNGDYRPDGVIIRVSGTDSRIVTTSTGTRYYRRKLSGTWLQAGGTWALVAGIVDERNPSF